MPFINNQSEGTCFIELQNEAQARIASNTFNGFGLDKKHTLRSCHFNDYENFLSVEEEFKMPQCAELGDLRDYLNDIDRDQYIYQESKTGSLNYHFSTMIQNRQNLLINDIKT